MFDTTLHDKIIEGAIVCFRREGIKFKMDDIAEELGMSKKTIYNVFTNKKELITDIADYVFDAIKEEEMRVASEEGLTTIEKLRKVLTAMPEKYASLDYTQFEVLKQKFPTVYREVENRLESGWDLTFSLLEQGIAEGSIKNVNLTMVKVMYQASIEQFFQKDVLKKSGYTYVEALNDITEIILSGITV